MSLFNHDATYYADKIRTKQTTVTELVERALINIKNKNKQLNAVVHIQKEAALQTAQTMDYHLNQLSTTDIDRLPPFYGVPTLLKDLGQFQSGHPSTSGSQLLKDQLATYTDHFVQTVLDAGFVIVGRTNVPEFGFKGVTDSELYGHAYAPFGDGLSAGGSSGGAGAAVKAGIVPVATASDGGGSIRIPASFNGLIGLKPTRGRIPTGPFTYRDWQGASINFWLTKSVRDTISLLQWQDQHQLENPFYAPEIKDFHSEIPARPLRIAYQLESTVGAQITPDAQEALEQTLAVLKDLGHELIEDAPEIDGQLAMETYFLMNMVEAAAMFKQMEQAMKQTIQQTDLELISWAMFRAGLQVPAWQYSQALNVWDQLANTYQTFLDDHQYDLYLTPTINGTTIPVNAFDLSDHHQKQLQNFQQLSKENQQAIFGEIFADSLNKIPYTQHANLTGQPALSLPMYETDAGLPVGSMFMARKGQEDILLKLALQIENNGHLFADIIK